MNSPMISVLMPVYNGEKYLREAIESILNQTYNDFEFIILNDGSTDRTEKIILSYDDSRIVYVKNEENLGIIKSLNKGLKLAKSKYIARMDADDISCPQRFKIQVKFMEANPDFTVCGTWTEVFREKDKYVNKTPVTNEEVKATLFFNSAIAHPTVFLRNKVIIEKELFYDENYIHVEDYELWCRMSSKIKFANIPEVLLEYRYHSESISLKNKVIQNEFSFKVATNQLKLLLRRQNISKEEIELHKTILGYNKNHCINIKNLVDWCFLLWKENNNTAQYSLQFFNRYLTFAWKTAINNSKNNLYRMSFNYLYLFVTGKVYLNTFIFFIRLSWWCLLQKFHLF